MSEEYIGKCALCGKTTTLEMSHIIPKLAIRRLKRTSIGAIRNTANPKIINGNGLIKAENQHIRSAVCNELLEIMQMVKKSGNDLSDIQRNKIEKKLLSAKDKLQSSEIYREVQKDINLKKS